MIYLQLFLFITSASWGTEIKLKDFNFSLPNIVNNGETSDSLFESMDREFVKTGSSICSNRAHMWANDFLRRSNIESGKIFMFYTPRNEDEARTMWWYHVAPLVNENGFLWVLDAGFPRSLQRPVTVSEWFESFSRSLTCKEIRKSEKDLVRLIFEGRVFPKVTNYGKHECYYIITPYSYWTPRQIAMNFLGEDEEGAPIKFSRDSIDAEDLYQACLEATTSKIGYALGSNVKKCQEYVSKQSL